MIHFADLGLCEPIQRALRAENYAHPTPIQARSIPELLAGRDLLGCAQTGTGKTAAFALPILERFAAAKVRPKPKEPRALVLVPTRELALQVKESFTTYGKFLAVTSTVVYGGVGKNPQVAALARGVDVLVATPGRLLDLMNDRAVRLSALEVFVLDEADQMLDLGFERDVERILKHLPAKRQSVFFSATMPPPIAKLAGGLLKDPARVVVTPVASTVDTVEQTVQFVETADKPARLADVLRRPEVERALIFVRTKHGANRLAKRLHQAGLRADAIHGNKSQNARERTLDAFRTARTPFLVATDIAARGIDVDGVTHVVNFDLPNVPEVYVHRIGRTARAGASGVAISFCSRAERPWLKDIERLIRRSLHVDTKTSFAKRGVHVDPSTQPTASAPEETGASSVGHERELVEVGAETQAAPPRRERRERGPRHEPRERRDRGPHVEVRAERAEDGRSPHDGERGRRDAHRARPTHHDTRPERRDRGQHDRRGPRHEPQRHVAERERFSHRAAVVEDHPPREAFGVGVTDETAARERGAPRERDSRVSHGPRGPHGESPREHTPRRGHDERPAHTGARRPQGGAHRDSADRSGRRPGGDAPRHGGKRFHRPHSHG